MNRHNFSSLGAVSSDFKFLNRTFIICPLCNNEVSSDEVIEIRGNVGCVICLK